jgi:hypothetical protein
LPTIRAYDAGARFYEAFLGYLDRNGAWWFCFISTSRWIGFRLDTIAAIMLTAGAMLAMAIHNKVTLQKPAKSLLFHLSCMPQKPKQAYFDHSQTHQHSARYSVYLALSALWEGASRLCAVSCRKEIETENLAQCLSEM